jgi:hypothetical protein
LTDATTLSGQSGRTEAPVTISPYEETMVICAVRVESMQGRDVRAEEVADFAPRR